MENLVLKIKILYFHKFFNFMDIFKAMIIWENLIKLNNFFDSYFHLKRIKVKANLQHFAEIDNFDSTILNYQNTNHQNLQSRWRCVNYKNNNTKNPIN